MQEPPRVYTPKRTSPHINPNVQRWLHDLVKLPEGTLKRLADYLVSDYRASNMNQGPEVDALITVTLLLGELDSPTLAEWPEVKHLDVTGKPMRDPEDQMEYLGG